MLLPARVLSALQAKALLFQNAQQRSGQSLLRYEKALLLLTRQSREDVTRALSGVKRPGALPTVERMAGRSVVLPFEPRWANHQEARAWAMEVLRGTTTLAVDGSQITPSDDFSVHVGAVQVGWFENPHEAEGRYVKDIRFEVLSPDELEDEEGEAGSFPDLQINLRRFELECQVLCEQMRQLAERRPAPVCFFDGSLVISFAAQMRPEIRRRYIEAVRAVLCTSREMRVPVVGYVDNSLAADLVSMLACLARVEDAPRIADGLLLHDRMAWGERSEAFLCARDDRLFEGEHAALDYYADVIFLYLKTAATHLPARLDLPAWLLEEGELERVVNVVRAECVVGTGYPYAVETADALAVITLEDRQRFYRAFQEFIASLGLELRYARKAYSKRGRR